jgi:hypothetical protein
MNHNPRKVMLLIDTDNVAVSVVEQAMARVMAAHGAVHLRRAYCTPESAVTHQKLFKTLGIRPVVNLSSGKNANDIALAVDAIDLAASERPDVVVIVSSDSDFAPLVLRLREKGCRVEGIGQLGKTGDEARSVYDDFVDLSHKRKVSDEAAPAPEPARKRAPSRRKAAAAPAAPLLPEEVQRIVDALPELRGGEKLELGIAAERLRAEGLLARNAQSTRLFKKYAQHFALTPERQPNKVRLLG